MNTNKEAIYSLISLLVKKAGADIDNTEAEEELDKTKEEINKLIKKLENSHNKKSISKLIENLRKRSSFWEDEPSIIGRELLSSFSNGEMLNLNKLEKLYELASRGTKEMQVSSVYSKCEFLEKEYDRLTKKIEKDDYVNYEEKEMDNKYKKYLEEKIKSTSNEIEEIDTELNSLRNVETKDVETVNKIKEYMESLDENMNKLENVTDISSNVSFDVWEKIETAKSDLENKKEKATDMLTKTEEMLSDVRKNRIILNTRKDSLNDEIKKCESKLEKVKEKLESNDYINETEKMTDITTAQKMKIEIKELQNKKDVVYVDALKVKEELVKMWKASPNKIEYDKKNQIEEKEERIEPLDETIHIDLDKIEQEHEELNKVQIDSEIEKTQVIEINNNNKVEDTIEEESAPEEKTEEVNNDEEERDEFNW